MRHYAKLMQMRFSLELKVWVTRWNFWSFQFSLAGFRSPTRWLAQCHFVDQKTTPCLDFQMVVFPQPRFCHRLSSGRKTIWKRGLSLSHQRSPINVGEWNLSSFGSNRIPQVMTAILRKQNQFWGDLILGMRKASFSFQVCQVFWKSWWTCRLPRICVGGGGLVFIGKDKSFSTLAWFLVAFQSFLRLKTLARLTAMEQRVFSF